MILAGRISVLAGALAALAMVLGAGPAARADQAPPAAAADNAATLFQNVRIFNGKSGVLSGPSNVLVSGKVIQKISSSPIDAGPGARVIDGGGRVLMPGLTDLHWHTMLIRATPQVMLVSDVGYTTLLAGAEAEATLMRGFTTVRDMGGPSFSLKRAIDEGVLVGPRIYPSGAMISVTSGHGDFRTLPELPRAMGEHSRIEVLGGAMIADSPDEVRLRAREQLMQGASQVKLTAGGGVASPFSPLDVSTFTEAELRAAVEAAENWGTVVCTHTYTSASMQRAIAAGVRCIEHGHLMDEPTARLIAEKGVWLSTQPFVDLSMAAGMGPSEQAKLAQVVSGTDNVYKLVRKYKIKTAFGTDILFSPALAARQAQGLVDLTRWYTPAEALIMATSTNGQMLRETTGLRNPYPGAIGVVEEGAFADLLLVNGDPLQDIKLVTDPERNFLVIMKDGKVYKDLVSN
jgi:imidazolonepropionase-like amidohydrolase